MGNKRVKEIKEGILQLKKGTFAIFNTLKVIHLIQTFYLGLLNIRQFASE